MTDNTGRRASKGNLMKVLNRILEELVGIHSQLKRLNGDKQDNNEYDSKKRDDFYRPQFKS